MIEINLLPGAKRSKGGGGLPSINFAAIGAAIAARSQGQVARGGVIAGIAVGRRHRLLLHGPADALGPAQQRGRESRRRFHALRRGAQRAHAAQARRDSASFSSNIIKAIDEERFIWPHVLEEVSEAMPQYTWLQVLSYTGTAQGTNPPAAFKQPAPDTSAQGRRRPPASPSRSRRTPSASGSSAAPWTSRR